MRNRSQFSYKTMNKTIGCTRRSGFLFAGTRCTASHRPLMTKSLNLVPGFCLPWVEEIGNEVDNFNWQTLLQNDLTFLDLTPPTRTTTQVAYGKGPDTKLDDIL